MTEMEKLFEKMLNMELTNEEMFEQCRNVAHKPMKKLCNTCEYLRYCARSGIEEVGCDRYKRDTTTNEEWFASLSTEEKARFLDKICYSAWGDKNSRFKDMADYTDWLEWLKEKHE